jgi:hypothetical protein
MRRPLALVVAALVSAFAALVLGEYDLTGLTPLVAGALLGVVVGEAAVLVVRERDVMVTAGSGACAAAAVVWAAWISAGRDWGYVRASALLGVVAAPAAVAWWMVRGTGRRGVGSPSEP